ncbi:hypothetical protein HK405_005082 [Cladochytrium tenue]|nr:hypothetical protein HK405_005082 [Cladochytrium tenue]
MTLNPEKKSARDTPSITPGRWLNPPAVLLVTVIAVLLLLLSATAVTSSPIPGHGTPAKKPKAQTLEDAAIKRTAIAEAKAERIARGPEHRAMNKLKEAGGFPVEQSKPDKDRSLVHYMVPNKNFEHMRTNDPLPEGEVKGASTKRNIKEFYDWKKKILSDDTNASRPRKYFQATSPDKKAMRDYVNGLKNTS